MLSKQNENGNRENSLFGLECSLFDVHHLNASSLSLSGAERDSAVLIYSSRKEKFRKYLNFSK